MKLVVEIRLLIQTAKLSTFFVILVDAAVVFIADVATFSNSGKVSSRNSVVGSESVAAEAPDR
jgi:hypothetical protein